MALLATKLKKQLLEEAEKANIEIDVKLRNIVINGTKRGCSGHVISGDSCVYLTTEESVCIPLMGKAMYRLAANPDDYSSTHIVNGHNRWCPYDVLATKVVATLKCEKPIYPGENNTVEVKRW